MRFADSVAIARNQVNTIEAFATLACGNKPHRCPQAELLPTRRHHTGVGSAHRDPCNRCHDGVILVRLPRRASPGPTALRHRLIERSNHPTDITRVQVAATNCREVTRPDDSSVVRCEVFEPIVQVIDFINSHVTTVAVALVEQATTSGVRLRRRHDFEELIADHHQCVVEAELTDSRIVKADGETERVAEFTNNGIEIMSDEGNLAETDHTRTVRTLRPDERVGAPLRSLIMSDDTSVRHPELGFYTLAGAPESPRDLIDEVRHAEELGLGAVFISERFNIKEAFTLSGAVGAVSNHIKIITGATNHNTRHPIVTAAHATTMHRLTGGRFSLGIGRGIAPLFDAYGINRITTAQMEDFAGVMRRLWHGETIIGHDGPIGKYPVLRLDPTFDEDIDLSIVAFGPNTLELGGRAFDNVILHTFFTDETVQRCVATVKHAAERAGRDPSDVKVWSCFATVGDHIDETLKLNKTVGRLATYLQAYGDLMVTTNNWDPARLTTFRADHIVQGIKGAIDAVATTEQLEHIATLLPVEWLAPAATGSAQQCAAAVRNQLSLGADAVIMHGATPTELAPIVAAY